MDEQSQRAALLSALTTEHFVLQTANNSTYSEASARSTLYVMARSSSLIAMGFVAGSADVLQINSDAIKPVRRTHKHACHHRTARHPRSFIDGRNERAELAITEVESQPADYAD
jgi:hypothetical protein